MNSKNSFQAEQFVHAAYDYLLSATGFVGLAGGFAVLAVHSVATIEL